MDDKTTPQTAEDLITELRLELQAREKRIAHLMSVIRGYNPDDALFDQEKELHDVEE